MDVESIVGELQGQHDRIGQALAILKGDRDAAPKVDGRHRRRHMSAASRRRISEQMKKRWAERKKAAAKHLSS